MKRWHIRFRHIGPEDYATPYMYLPIQETIREAENEEAAWNGLLDYWEIPQERRADYQRIEIFAD